MRILDGLFQVKFIVLKRLQAILLLNCRHDKFGGIFIKTLLIDLNKITLLL